MLRIFGRRRREEAAPRISTRSDSHAADRGSTADVARIAPTPAQFLGAAASLQLVLAQNVLTVAHEAPTIEFRVGTAESAATALDRYRSLLGEISRAKLDVTEISQPYENDFARLGAVLVGDDWAETATAYYLAAGLLNDLFRRLRLALSHDLSARLAGLFDDARAEEQLHAILRQTTERDEELASRLAMWGRRITGDVILVARLVLAEPEKSTPAVVEAAMTELIADHTRRMDSIGLTA